MNVWEIDYLSLLKSIGAANSPPSGMPVESKDAVRM